jgi:hypothetical protein
MVDVLIASNFAVHGRDLAIAIVERGRAVRVGDAASSCSRKSLAWA